MADRLIARSALGSTQDGGLRAHGDPAVVALREMPASATMDLRLDPANSAALTTAQSALGLTLPLTPGKTVVNAGRVVWWFGPNQWLVTVPHSTGTLIEALSRDDISAVEVSDLRSEFELAGPRAVDVLRKGCAIDLHPRVFGPGDCALTALARVRVALRQIDERPCYRLLAERSIAPYLWSWLTDAMIEFGGD